MDYLEKAGGALIEAANSIRNYLLISFLFGLTYGLLMYIAPTMVLWLEFVVIIYLIASVLTIYGLLIGIKSAGKDLQNASKQIKSSD